MTTQVEKKSAGWSVFNGLSRMKKQCKMKGHAVEDMLLIINKSEFDKLQGIISGIPEEEVAEAGAVCATMERDVSAGGSSQLYGIKLEVDPGDGRFTEGLHLYGKGGFSDESKVYFGTVSLGSGEIEPGTLEYFSGNQMVIEGNKNESE